MKILPTGLPPSILMYIAEVAKLVDIRQVPIVLFVKPYHSLSSLMVGTLQLDIAVLLGYRTPLFLYIPNFLYPLQC